MGKDTIYENGKGFTEGEEKDFLKYNQELDKTNNIENYFEDAEYIKAIQQGYMEVGYFMDAADNVYTNDIEETSTDVVKNVVAELAKIQSSVLNGEVKIDKGIKYTTLEESYLGNELGNMTKTDVISRMTAVRDISDIILKCMGVLDNEDEEEYVLIREVVKDLFILQSEISDIEFSEVVKVEQMIIDLENVS